MLGKRSPRQFRNSLRARLALGVALPVLLALISLSLVHYWRERNLMEDQIRVMAVQLARVMTGSLRHTMLHNDREMIAQVLSDVGSMTVVERVQLVNAEGQVKADSQATGLGHLYRLSDPGCVECHQYAPIGRPRTVLLGAQADTLRIAAPIANEPQCTVCHPQQSAHLGILLADVPLLSLEQHLAQDLQLDLIAAAIIALLVTVGVYMAVHWLVVQRVESFRQPLAEYSAGNFASRLPIAPTAGDEIDELAQAFNRMADDLQRHAREQEERAELRQKAIIEERERIARELHDGLAQVLGYVNTKAMAVRLMLKKGQYDSAGEHLLQLEEAAREVFVDVREAILGLRVAGQMEMGLAAMLTDYAAHFGRLSGIPVEVRIAPEAEALSLPSECELQLLRIVQEGLTNVRKHAAASRAWVDIGVDAGYFRLTVGDNGRGFSPNGKNGGDGQRFGLNTMRERAEAIGAEFCLDSRPGAGTHIAIRLIVPDGEGTH